ncbi:MAG TPA: hypothetical protein VF526_15355 [Solirubrobacteraceae bacterium]|jgi:hypothetical protein
MRDEYDPLAQSDPTDAHQLWWGQFPAKLISRSLAGGVYLYGWTEQQAGASSGALADGPAPRRGTPALSPAYELNNRAIDVAGEPVVLLRFRAMVNGQVTWDFDGSAPSTYFSNVTITVTDASVVNIDETVINYGPLVTVNFLAVSTWSIALGVYWAINGPGYLVVNAPFEICGALIYCYDTPEPFTIDTGDWTPAEKVVHRVSSTEPLSLSGIEPHAEGGVSQPQFIALADVGDQPLRLTAFGADEPAGARPLIFPGEAEGQAGPLEMGAHDTALLWYDPDDDPGGGTEAWRYLAGTCFVPRIQGEGFAGGDLILRPNCHCVALDVAADCDLEGMGLPQAGRHVCVINGGGGVLTVKHAGGVTGRSFGLPGGEDIEMQPGDALLFFYDGVVGSLAGGGFWRVVGSPYKDVFVTASPSDTTPGRLRGVANSDTDAKVVSLDGSVTINLGNAGGNEYLDLAVDFGTFTPAIPNDGSVTSGVSLTATYADTGATAGLPGAGTFLLWAQCDGTIASNSAGDRVEAKLRDATNAADVGVVGTCANIGYVAFGASGTDRGSATLVGRLVTAGAVNVKVQARYVRADPLFATSASLNVSLAWAQVA